MNKSGERGLGYDIQDLLGILEKATDIRAIPGEKCETVVEKLKILQNLDLLRKNDDNKIIELDKIKDGLNPRLFIDTFSDVMEGVEDLTRTEEPMLQSFIKLEDSFRSKEYSKIDEQGATSRLEIIEQFKSLIEYQTICHDNDNLVEVWIKLQDINSKANEVLRKKGADINGRLEAFDEKFSMGMEVSNNQLNRKYDSANNTISDDDYNFAWTKEDKLHYKSNEFAQDRLGELIDTKEKYEIVLLESFVKLYEVHDSLDAATMSNEKSQEIIDKAKIIAKFAGSKVLKDQVAELEELKKKITVEIVAKPKEQLRKKFKRSLKNKFLAFVPREINEKYNKEFDGSADEYLMDAKIRIELEGDISEELFEDMSNSEMDDRLVVDSDEDDYEGMEDIFEGDFGQTVEDLYPEENDPKLGENDLANMLDQIQKTIDIDTKAELLVLENFVKLHEAPDDAAMNDNAIKQIVDRAKRIAKFIGSDKLNGQVDKLEDIQGQIAEEKVEGVENVAEYKEGLRKEFKNSLANGFLASTPDEINKKYDQGFERGKKPYLGFVKERIKTLKLDIYEEAKRDLAKSEVDGSVDKVDKPGDGLLNDEEMSGKDLLKEFGFLDNDNDNDNDNDEDVEHDVNKEQEKAELEQIIKASEDLVAEVDKFLETPIVEKVKPPRQKEAEIAETPRADDPKKKDLGDPLFRRDASELLPKEIDLKEPRLLKKGERIKGARGVKNIEDVDPKKKHLEGPLFRTERVTWSKQKPAGSEKNKRDASTKIKVKKG